MADVSRYPGTPRWVKVSGIIVAGLILLIMIVIVTGIGGPHGPGLHLRSGDVGEAASPDTTSIPQTP